MRYLGRARDRARRIWEPGGTLTARALKGGFWVVAFRVAGRSGTLLRTVVLARILAPSDFGLMGIAVLTMSVLETVSQTGFGSAFIQREGSSEEYLDTAWTVSVGRGILLSGVLCLLAPWVARFFDTALAGPVLRVASFSVLLNGLTNPGVLYFRKELEFNRQFLYRLSGTAADLIVAVGAGLLLRNVWALVLGLVARSLVQLIMSYVLHGFRPAFHFDSHRAGELFNFGRWILGSHVIGMLIRQGDSALIGRLVGATGLGYYQMATQISVAPATEIADQVCQVAFPTYAKVQDRRELLRRVYGMAFRVVALLGLPVAGGILVLAREITEVLLGPQWLPMVPALRVLSVFGAARAINSVMATTFEGTGRPAITTKGLLAQLILLAALIYPLVTWNGVVGAAIAVTVAELIFLLYGVFRVRHISGQTLQELMQPMAVGMLCTAVMVLVVLGLRGLVVDAVSLFLLLPLLVCVGVAAYLGAMLLADRTILREFRHAARVVRVTIYPET